MKRKISKELIKQIADFCEWYEGETIFRTDEGWFKKTTTDLLFHQKASVDINGPDGKLITADEVYHQD